MGRVSKLASGAYRRLLVLYPAAFRHAFAEEMAWVFTAALEEAAQGGSRPVMRMLAREMGELPLSILLEHLHERKKQAMQYLQIDLKGDIQLFRWGARGLSLLPLAYYLLIMILNEDVRAEPAPALLIQGCLTLALLAAWRWEKEGGAILVSGAPILWLLYTLSGLRFNFTFLSAALVGGLVALPYLLIGWLFYSVGSHSALASEMRPNSGPARSRSRLPLAIAGLLILALVTVILLLLSLVATSPEGKVTEIPIGPCAADEKLIRSSQALVEWPSPLPGSLKGYELYSYRKGGQWFFTFEVGLNRIRTSEDMPAAIVGTSFTVQGFDQLQEMLAQMPQGEDIIWCGYERPGVETVNDLQSLSEELGLAMTLFER